MTARDRSHRWIVIAVDSSPGDEAHRDPCRTLEAALVLATHLVSNERIALTLAETDLERCQRRFGVDLPTCLIPRSETTSLLAGITLAIAAILEKDPAAQIGLLPIALETKNESLLASCIEEAFHEIELDAHRVAVLAYPTCVRPDEQDLTIRFTAALGVSESSALSSFGLQHSSITIGRPQDLIDLCQRRPEVLQLPGMQLGPGESTRSLRTIGFNLGGEPIFDPDERITAIPVPTPFHHHHRECPH